MNYPLYQEENGEIIYVTSQGERLKIYNGGVAVLYDNDGELEVLLKHGEINSIKKYYIELQKKYIENNLSDLLKTIELKILSSSEINVLNTAIHYTKKDYLKKYFIKRDEPFIKK